MKKLDTVKEFIVNIVFIDGKKSQQFVVENIAIPPNTINFKLSYNRLLRVSCIKAILDKIRRKGLKFTFFGAATKFTPEEYFLLFK